MTEQFPTEPTNPYSGKSASQTYGQPGGYGVEQQPISPGEERTWGVVAHGAALAAMVFSVGTLGFVASLVIYVMYKDRGPFVRQHAANSLNIQISMVLWLVPAAVLYFILGVLTLGVGFFLFLPVFIVPAVVAGILHVIGAIKANNGEWWNPPMTPRFVR